MLSAGCNDFLRKPFKEAEIFDLLHKHLGVQFVYEEEQHSTLDTQHVTLEEVLTPEALTALPDAWLADLRQANESIDVVMINSIIDRIRSRDEPLADALAKLVKQYRFDTLQELFEELNH